MCGICGIIRMDGAPVEPARAERMRDVMAPRGPDGFGLSQGPGFALGHRRLAIIDLSNAGCQPMENEDGSIQIVFNGEIYNFGELRPELEAAGHEFRSRSDTEVLLHGYEEWGIERLLQRIRGIYAFALLDSRRGEVHLARDPVGKKPLYFRWKDGELAFASSARALALGLDATPAVDLSAVHDLLWHLYIPGPRTIFRGVEKLAPGHSLTLTRDGERRDFAHWKPDFFHPEQGVDNEEWLQRIEAALIQAIRRRLIADVPVEYLLSGGVDSGLVTALAAKIVGRVKTFSVATEDPALDESHFARAVAERYNTDHHSLPVRGHVREDLPRLVASMGEPLGDSSAANLFAIAQLARQSVTVVLTGDGGDEVFGGYRNYLTAYLAGRLRAFVPGLLLPPLEKAGEILRRAPSPIHSAGTLLRVTAAPVEKSFRQLGRILDEPTRAALFTAEFREQLNGHDATQHYADAMADGNGALQVDRVMQAQLRTLMVDDYLSKVDLSTMAASLEARCPFLDQDVVELGMRIPAASRFHRNQPKGLLRELARRYLPPAGVNRRKQGFRAPIGLWLRHNWTDLVDDVVLGPHVERRGWFRREALQRLVDEHRQGADRAHLLWTLLVLELWVRMAVDGTLQPDDAI